MKFSKPISYKLKAKSSKGFALVEVIIGMGIAAFLLTTFSSIALQSKKVSRANMRNFKAALYLREAIEVAKDLEQTNWASFANPLCVSTPYCHPQAAGSTWTLAGAEELLDDGMFARTLSVSSVYRDPVTNAIDLADPPTGALDPNTKKVTAAVRWDTGYVVRTGTLEAYIYNMP
ncbi:MAG: type II secretion system protein [bacterium]|nr:type II secretion system protein [bacterium]